jgi:hypothetical protein
MLLDDLEDAEQTFLEKEAESEEMDTELDDLLAEDEPPVSPETSTRYSGEDSDCASTENGGDAFDRLYQTETEASMGQQHVSDKPRKSPAKQMNRSPSVTPTRPSSNNRTDNDVYSITRSKMVIQALKEIRNAATAQDLQQLKLISMKESFDLALLTSFYNDLMIPNFPLEDERDDLEDWVFCLEPAKKEQMDAEHGPSMDVLILVGARKNNNDNVIIAGIAFEYYRQAQTGLLSYMVVADEFRRLGILRSLHPVALEAMQQLHHVSIQYQRRHSNGTNTSLTKKIKAIFAETNTVDAGDASPEVIKKRHKILHRLGYRHLKFPYVQPPLAEDGDSFDDIMLLIHCSNAKNSGIHTDILYNYVVDFFQSVSGYDNDNYKQHWYYKLVRWFRKHNPKTEISGDLPWHDVTEELHCAMESESQQEKPNRYSLTNSVAATMAGEQDAKRNWIEEKGQLVTVEQSYWVERLDQTTPAKHPLPFLSPCSSADDASTSTDSSRLPDSPDSSYSVQSTDASLISVLFPSSSSSLKAPWKMALTQKADPLDKEQQLYIRSMSNILYDLGTGRATEMEVAEALITALFHRDYVSSKYWKEESASVTEKEGVKHRYTARKGAEGWEVRGIPRRTMSTAEIHFDHSKRVVRVNDYQHSFEDALQQSVSQ